MLYMIGLGLNDETDITQKGLSAIKKSNKVFLEGYTSLLQCSTEDLERTYDKKITVLGRTDVEQHANTILEAAKKDDAAFLVVGDVFTATTHTDLYQRARQAGIDVQVIPNAGIINAVSITGLDLYKFGRTTTIVYPEKNYRPTSYYDAIRENKRRGLHTLCLLDIKREEERYMTIPEALQQLLSIAAEQDDDTINTNTKALGVARLTSKDQKIRYGTITELTTTNWGRPPHCIVIPGNLHVVEEELLTRPQE